MSDSPPVSLGLSHKTNIDFTELNRALKSLLALFGFVCSHCKEPVSDQFHYCPRCGAALLWTDLTES